MLAALHHILILSLASILAMEIVLVRVDIGAADLRRVASVDLWYGLVAAATLAIGFTRAVVGAKGWVYYAGNHFFWAKIATFVLIGLLSIAPTIRIARWSAAHRNGGSGPSRDEVMQARRFLWAEAALFPLLPVFAAAMARGYGS